MTTETVRLALETIADLKAKLSHLRAEQDKLRNTLKAWQKCYDCGEDFDGFQDCEACARRDAEEERDELREKLAAMADVRAQEAGRAADHLEALFALRREVVRLRELVGVGRG